MIDFYSETTFQLENTKKISQWISETIAQENFEEGDITYVFCDDAYLHSLNVEFLNHDTLTDIISFDYSLGKQIHGEIYISIERVEENALEYNVPFLDELLRVMIHGVLHYCGYKDKTQSQKQTMRSKEDEAIKRYKSLTV